MKIVVLGATGGLGGRLAIYLHSRKFEILGVGRDAEKLWQLKSPGINTVLGALDALEVIAAIKAFGPDIIINATGKSGFSRGKAVYAKANIETAGHAVNLARAANKCRLIHLSSPSVSYRAHDCLNIKEDKPFSPPVSAYAWSRQQAELMLNAVTDVPITIIRLRSAYGYGVPSPLQSVRQKIINRSFLPLVRGGQVAIDLVHIDDVLEAIEAIIQVGQTLGHLTLNVAGPEALSFKQMVDGIAAYEGLKPKWLPLPGITLAFAGPIAEIMMLFLNENREPDISAHMAGSLLYSQTLDLTHIKAITGWSPKLTFADVLKKRLL